MSYDLLFVASEAATTTNFSHLDFQGLEGKYGLSEVDWRKLVDAHEPRWTVDGVDMVFPALEPYFRGGRRLRVTAAQRADYYAHRRGTEIRYLNGVFIADYLIRRGHTVEVVNALSPDFRELADALARGPRAVAISTTFLPNRRRVQEIARWIKRADPEVKVIVGGPLVSYSWMIRTQAPELAELDTIRQIYFFQGDDAEPDPVIDAFVVDAHGVATLERMLTRIEAGEHFTDLPNVGRYDASHRVTVNPLVPEEPKIEDEKIDWLNLDDRFLGPRVAMRGSWGCPLRCKFCSFVVLYPDWELKSVEFLRQELLDVAARGVVSSVCFVDDNLFLRRAQVDRYSRMMAEADLPFHWYSFIRADSVTKDNVDWIADSKCGGVMLGIESGDAGVLKNMRKVQRSESVLRSVGLMNERGISTNSTFIVGFPGETEESVDRTIDLLKAFPDSGAGTNWFKAWVNLVLPLTPADKERDTWGLRGYLCDWEHDTMDVAEAYRQAQRIYHSVDRGAYVSYDYDDFSLFEGRPAERLAALRLRHALAIMGERGTDSHGGTSRAEALDGLERIVLGTATSTA